MPRLRTRSDLSRPEVRTEASELLEAPRIDRDVRVLAVLPVSRDGPASLKLTRKSVRVPAEKKAARKLKRVATPKAKPVRLTDEHTEQCFLMQWCEVSTGRLPELAAVFAVPNFARVSPRWGAWMKAEGKRAGVPDIILPVPRGPFASLYIELKVKPNRVSPEQLIWHERLRRLGNRVEVCWTWHEARLVIEGYLALSNVRG